MDNSTGTEFNGLSEFGKVIRFITILGMKKNINAMLLVFNLPLAKQHETAPLSKNKKTGHGFICISLFSFILFVYLKILLNCLLIN